MEQTKEIALPCPVVPWPVRTARSLADRARATPRSYRNGAIIGLGGFLLIRQLLLGSSPEAFLVCLLMALLCFWSDTSRRFALGFLPFVAQTMVYDLTHFTEPLVRFLHVHIAEPYLFDRAHFGIMTARGIVTPNEFFARHYCSAVDFVTGCAYMTHLYLIIAFTAYLSATSLRPDRRLLLKRFGWAFFALSLAGFATYYIYPAAPPWYVAAHGIHAAPDFSVQASLGGTARWDALTGINYFHAFYGRSADVFGAIPSLHVGTPCLMALYVAALRKPWLTTLAVGYYLLVCFSAIYLQHHYILDAMLGTLFALTVFTVERLITRSARRTMPSLQPAAA